MKKKGHHLVTLLLLVLSMSNKLVLEKDEETKRPILLMCLGINSLDVVYIQSTMTVQFRIITVPGTQYWHINRQFMVIKHKTFSTIQAISNLVC